MAASATSDQILSQCNKFGVDMFKLLTQEYDGCSAMAGKEDGFQVKIRNVYPIAAFVHCTAHRLILVVNDLNSVAQVRKPVITNKVVFKIFRESTTRKASVEAGIRRNLMCLTLAILSAILEFLIGFVSNFYN